MGIHKDLIIADELSIACKEFLNFPSSFSVFQAIQSKKISTIRRATTLNAENSYFSTLRIFFVYRTNNSASLVEPFVPTQCRFLSWKFVYCLTQSRVS